MPDARLAEALLTERYGDPSAAAAERIAPRPLPPPGSPDDTPERHRKALLEALRPRPRAA